MMKSTGQDSEKRTWDNPTRKPWNPVIKACLNAIDEHIRLHLLTGEVWHLSQAEILRQYVRDLKDWINHTELK